MAGNFRQVVRSRSTSIQGIVGAADVMRRDTADFLDRPADQERRFGRDRSFVFLSDRPVLAR